jgi:F-type H+-transporting ATPase subunit b
MHEESFFANPRTWVGVAFVLFVVIFGRRIWKALVDMLDKRTAAVQRELGEARRLRQEAEAMLADASRRREAALAEAKVMLERAHAEAERLSVATAAEAEAAARRREKMAMDRIAAAEKAAVDEVRFAAAEIATVAAERVIRENLTPDADAHLVDHAIGSLAGALAPRRAAA